MASAKAPDTSGQNAAALLQAQLSKEQLAWAKEIYAQAEPERIATTARANEVSDAQLEQTRLQTSIAQQAQDDYNGTYRPIEQAMAQEAVAYDTPERRAAAAAAATSDVERNIAAQRGATMRDMERSGVDPSSGKMAAVQGSIDLGAAKLKAGAGNTAMRQVETIGAAKRADAVNLGRGIASSQATNASLAMQQGNASVANSGAALTATNNGQGNVSSAYGGAQTGLSGAASTFGSIAAGKGAADAANASSTNAGIGAAASIAAMIFMSDKNKKKDIKPTDPDAALEAIEATPVSTWKYDASKGGIDDGEATHMGPMAQDVQKNMGDDVAPGGKVIDAVSANGMAMAAIQGLSRKVDRLASKIEKPKARAVALEH